MRHFFASGMDGTDEERSDIDSEEESETEPNSLLIEDCWNQVSSLHKRQIGLNSRYSNAHSFKQLVYPSLSLVQRLKLNSKLVEHRGCVNALQFNNEGLILFISEYFRRRLITNCVLLIFCHSTDNVLHLCLRGYIVLYFQFKYFPYIEKKIIHID